MSSNFPPEMMKDSPLFQELSVQEIEQLLAVADDCEFHSGSVIFHEGGYGPELYVIMDGEVEIALPAPAYNETLVSRLGPGSVFGESTFFHAGRHVATARCADRVLALRLSRDRFDRLLGQGCLAAYKVAANAAKILAQRLQATDRWIENLVQERQDTEVAAHWREFRHRMAFGRSFAAHGPVGSITPGGS